MSHDLPPNGMRGLEKSQIKIHRAPQGLLSLAIVFRGCVAFNDFELRTEPYESRQGKAERPERVPILANLSHANAVSSSSAWATTKFPRTSELRR
jgi:hypothetical protein